MGHALTSGISADLVVLGVGLSVALAWGWLLTYGRPPAALVLATVVTVQVAIHGALRAHASVPVASEHGHDLSGAQTTHQGLLGGSPTTMLAVHALATIVGLALLLHLERRAWAAVRRIGLVLVRVLRASGRRPEPPTEHRWILGARHGLGIPRWWGAVSGCRGPPAVSVGFR